jgi:hypothetical protein
MEHRSRDIVIYRNRHPDVYVYNYGMSPNYGHYDSAFLMGLMLGHLGSNRNTNASWMYAHQSDPWYPQWRADMERKAQENAELKAKLASMDADMAQLKAQNAKPAVTALPEGVSGSIAIAPEAMIAAEDKDTDESSHFWAILFGILGAGLIGAIGYFYVVGSRR